MPKLIIHIEMDNAAFYDDDRPRPGHEAARILRALAARIQDADELNIGMSLPLRDVNGNRVGGWKVT